MLTRFVNDYFMQQLLTSSLQSRWLRLETLELHNFHLGKTLSGGDDLPYLKTLACDPEFSWH
jgi:hypothetical protein